LFLPLDLNTKRNVWSAAKLLIILRSSCSRRWQDAKTETFTGINHICPTGILNGIRNSTQPRYPFIAIAEIIHPESGGILGSRVAKISLNGCFVETTKALPVGSEVVIKIFAESECFAATAKVVYANSNSGVGLAFREVPAKSAALLRQWLLKASDAPK
jgi:hypothetical protein